MNNQKIKDILKDPNTNWRYVIIVAILAFLVASGILICVLTEKEFEIPIIKLPKKVVAENETADWKTYRSEEFGFEIDYPADFVLQKEKNSAGEIWLEGEWISDFLFQTEKNLVGLLSPQDQEILESGVWTGYWLKGEWIEEDESLEGWIESKCPLASCGRRKVIIGKNLLEGYRVTEPGIGVGFDRYFIRKGRAIITISNGGSTAQFNQILSTFKFLD